MAPTVSALGLMEGRPDPLEIAQFDPVASGSYKITIGIFTVSVSGNFSFTGAAAGKYKMTNSPVPVP